MNISYNMAEIAVYRLPHPVGSSTATDNFMTVRFHYEMLLPLLAAEGSDRNGRRQCSADSRRGWIPTWQFTRGGNSKTVYRLVGSWIVDCRLSESFLISFTI